ncbi:MAG TPA: fibronectin type III domain-containing protein, partial [Pyrinomonadaceae bacterium]|nr:fibronectin type III domain-containing protein [Pyrinomonadaceae bacterium]
MRILSRLVALSFTFALAAAGIFAQQELVTDRIDQGKRILQPEPISKKNASKEPTLNLISATTYTFASSSGAVLEDMSSGTTLLVGPSLDDNASVATPLGFTFVYDGVQFTQFSVNANGLLRLGGVVVSTGFTNSLASTTDAPKIAAYWEDLCTGSNGKVHFKTVGSAPNRKVVVEWQNMQVTRGAGCAGTGNGTFQATLFESTGSTTPGAIKFVYGAMGIPATADAGYSIGLQSGGATNFASVTSSASTVSYTTANNTNLTALDAGTSYTFSPNVPIAPTDAGTTNITPVSFQLNWLDNSTTETSYILQRSDEGINYQTIATLPANTTTYTDIGRAPNTPYFYRIQGVSEGAFGPFGSITATTSIPTEDSCVGSGGNWNTPGTWLDGSVPTATTNVTIGTGCTVTIDTAASAVNVNVQSGATLLFDSGTAQSLTAGYDVTIAAGGTLQTASSGSVTTHQLNVGRTLTNNGVLDLSTNSDTAGAVLQFNNPNRADFLGTGVTTDLLTLTVNKGTGLVNPQTGPVLDVVLSNMTVKGLSTATAGFLNLTTANGLLYFSGSNSFSGPVFQTAAYTIPSSFSFGVNNPNFTVTGQDGSPTLAGRLVVSQGVFNIGTSNGNSMGFNTGASVVVGNGTVNATGRFGVNVSTNVIGYTQTGGTVNVQTIGNASTTLAGFDLGTSAASTVSITGGDIVVQLASTAATTPRDYRNQAGTGTLGVTGGNLRLGNASSGAAKIFNILGVIANLFVTNTSAGHTALYGTPVTYNNVTRNITIDSGATLNPGNFVFLFNGTTLTNNGTLTHNGASSNFVTFNTVAPVLYTGTGSVTTPLTALALQSDQGFTIDPGANNFTATALRVFGGNFN